MHVVRGYVLLVWMGKWFGKSVICLVCIRQIPGSVPSQELDVPAKFFFFFSLSFCKDIILKLARSCFSYLSSSYLSLFCFCCYAISSSSTTPHHHHFPHHQPGIFYGTLLSSVVKVVTNMS